jgi:hypothetical protein
MEKHHINSLLLFVHRTLISYAIYASHSDEAMINSFFIIFEISENKRIRNQKPG